LNFRLIWYIFILPGDHSPR